MPSRRGIEFGPDLNLITGSLVYMINLSEVGAFPSVVPGGFQIKFGIYLPGIRAADGFDVVVRVIHSADRFNPSFNRLTSISSGTPVIP